MTQTQKTHTPGPWGYRRHLKTTHITSDRFRKSMQDPWYIHGPLNDSDFLADVFMKKDESSGSNVRLIAAAPDLLAACKDLLRMVDGLPWHVRDAVQKEFNDRTGGLPGTLPKPITTARAAIAKAEGRE